MTGRSSSGHRGGRWWCVALAAVGVLLSPGCKDKRKTQPATSQASAAAISDATPIRVIDVHVHLDSRGVERLMDLMNRYGIDHVVNLSGGHPLAGLQQQMMAAGWSHGKVSVFTMLPFPEFQRPGYGERIAALLERARQMGAKGLKIPKALGLGLRDPTTGSLIPVDDPQLDPVFERAGQLDMPVAIHTGDPLAFWQAVTPENERYAELSAHPGWALHGRSVPSFEELYAQLERRFARHPGTKFISVHFGNLAEDPDRVAQTLRRYPNVYIDTAARIPEMGRHPPSKMRAFFEEFQDRILFGSDLGVGPAPTPLFLGSSGRNAPTDAEQELFFSATRRYFETADANFPHPTPIQGDWTISGIDLPRPILEKVMYKNAQKLLGIALD
jgi:predicted TIM-barrel fold metal-dependent hydrolase